jgi:hypothetical protein
VGVGLAFGPSMAGTLTTSVWRTPSAATHPLLLLTSMLELRRPVLASSANDVCGSDADNVVPLRTA